MALAHLETNIPVDNLLLIYNGVPMTDYKKPLAEYGIKNDDIVFASTKRKQASVPSSSSNMARLLVHEIFSVLTIRTLQEISQEDMEYEHLRQSILGNPLLSAQISRSQPAVLDAAKTNFVRFKELMRPIIERQRQEAAQIVCVKHYFAKS